MKAKTKNATKKRAQHDRVGSKKSDVTNISGPSSEAHPGVETELTSVNDISAISKKVTSQKHGIIDELVPSNPPLPGGVLGGFAEQSRTNAILAERLRKIWEPRLEKEFHFEVCKSFCFGYFNLLFFRGLILVSADDLARAATSAWHLVPERAFKAAEILEIVDARDLIVVPGPEIPANFDEAFGGTYVQIEFLLALLWGTEFRADTNEFYRLFGDFDDRKKLRLDAGMQEAKMREERLGVKRVEEAMLELIVRRAKARTAKMRSEKRNA